MDQVPEAPAVRETRGGKRSPLRTGARVFAVGALAGLAIFVASFAVLAPLTAGQRRADVVANDDLAIQRQAASLRATLVRWQLFLEPKFDAYQAGTKIFDPSDIATGSELTKSQIAQATKLTAMLRVRGVGIEARGLDDAMKALTASITGLSPVASGTRLTPAQFGRIVAAERSAYSGAWERASTINQNVSLHTTTPDVAYTADRIRVARTIIVVVGGLLTLLALILGGIAARRASRLQRRQDVEAQRTVYGQELQQALEMSTTEDAVYSVVGRALGGVVPDLDVELLIADSSNAHFRRVLTNHDDDAVATGCDVVSPRDCPAAIRGHPMEFQSSEAISACPHLRGRPSGPCSAVCIPVSIAGSTVGVMHATGADGTLPDAADLENLELSTRRSAERVALLRAFAKSEAQAHTDPLTGLLNRRSLEDQVRDLQREGMPYALAYGDLDFFKQLNDTHGHEAGDRALRLFARVMRDAVRPADLVARYGGEEFVIVLPDCGTDAAVVVLERVRERLALALMSGRLPQFTVSFGVATSSEAPTFDAVVAAADSALLEAKDAGRDRILVNRETGSSVTALPGYDVRIL